MRISERFRKLTIWNKLGFIGSIASILSFAALFMVEGRHRIEPCYTIGWHDLIASTTDNAPKLRFTWEGKEYSNIYTARIAVWNQGRQFMDHSVMSSSDPIRIVYPEGIKILSAQVAFTSRTSLHLQARPHTHEGREVVVLDIGGDDALDYHDGGIVSVTYTKAKIDVPFGQGRGSLPDSDIDFEVRGRIKGSGDEFRRVPFWDAITPRWLNVGAIAVFGFHFLLIAFVGLRASREPAKPLELVVGVFAFLLSFGLCFVILYHYITASVHWPNWINGAA